MPVWNADENLTDEAVDLAYDEGTDFYWEDVANGYEEDDD